MIQATTEMFDDEWHHVPLLQRTGIDKLVVFRALQLGDMLCAIPALRALRNAVPSARITLVGLPWAEQFARRFHHYVDDFIAFPGHPAFPEQAVREDRIDAFYEAMRERQFDLSIQMHGSGQISNRIVDEFGARMLAGYCAMDDRSYCDSRFFVAYPDKEPEPIRLLRLMQSLGAASVGTELEFPITKEDEEELDASRLATGLAPGSYICIHSGASIRDKCWPPQRFAEVADRLADESGLAIVLTGSAKEAELTATVAAHMHNKVIDTAAPISIGAMAALMSRARLLICNDTGVSHIAVGLRLPSVVIFSIADMQRWSPINQELHRCVKDAAGKKAATVLAHARDLFKQNSANTLLDRSR